MDVRVTHMNSKSYKDMNAAQVYKQHEGEKKRKYNQRVLQVEKASFTPLIFSTTGGMAPECERFHKKVAAMISDKTKEDYSKVMDYIRTRVRFTILKSTLVALRGEKGKKNKAKDVTDISFNTVPDMASYEP